MEHVVWVMDQTSKSQDVLRLCSADLKRTPWYLAPVLQGEELADRYKCLDIVEVTDQCEVNVSLQLLRLGLSLWLLMTMPHPLRSLETETWVTKLSEAVPVHR